MKWEMVKLGDICDLSQGIQVDIKDQSLTKKGNQVRFLRIIDFTQGGDAPRYIDNPGERYFLKENDLALVRYGSTGFVCRGLEGVIANNLFKVTPKQNTITNDFLYWILISDNFQNFVKLNNKGAALQAISFGQIKAFQIPLPPLTVQKEIAEILDTADALRKKDNELLKKYDELAQSIFIEMFGDPVRNEKGWEVKKLGDCILKIQIGPFGTQLHESDYIQNGIPIINPMHMSDMKIHPNSNYSITKEKFNELKQYHLKKNDIILARRGEMGRCAIVTESEKGFLCGTGSLFLTVNESILHPLFLVYLLSRESMKKSLSNVATGTTMLNLNKDIVSNFMIIVPKIERQLDFIKSMEINEQNIALLKNQITHTNNLFHSLLQKAFKGELT